MTKNMIDYRSLEEQRRHNREMERLTGEQQEEAKRHNLVSEAEAHRSNTEQEKLKHEATQASIFSTQVQAKHYATADYYSYEYPETFGKTQAEVEYTQAKTQNTYQDTGKKRSEVAVNYATVDKVKADTAYQHARALLTAWEIEKTQADITNTKASTNKLVADTRTSKLTGDKNVAEIEKIKKQTKYLGWDSVTRGIGNLTSAARDASKIATTWMPEISE